jgi:dTDP-4-amino-4,6-dideoxygalactose transaminase
MLGMGEEVQKFESEIKEYLQTPLEVICVNTGTSALQLALSCLDIGYGDEVLVPTITYVATFQAITACGAVPIPCDVTIDRVFIDLNDAKKRITNKTKAIIPVHYASDSTEMSELYRFANHCGIRVIEDAAHAFGGNRDGHKIGFKGDIICFSFDGIKNITSGEGGAVITGDGELANRIRDARLLGVERDTENRFRGERSWNFDVKFQGYRFHMSNLMAAIGREQLKKINHFSIARRKLANFYYDKLKNLSDLEFLDLDKKNIIPHIFVVKIANNKRNHVMKSLRQNGIECGLHYHPNHLTTFFKSSYSLPNSELLAEQLLSLPLHVDLKSGDQTFVCNILKQALNEE